MVVEFGFELYNNTSDMKIKVATVTMITIFTTIVFAEFTSANFFLRMTC